MSFKETALRLINEHGEAVKITRKSGGAVDPVTGNRSSSVEQVFNVFGVKMSDKSSIGRYFSAVSASDLVYMMDASVTYKAGDKATINSNVYLIDEVAEESQKGDAVYFMVRLTK